MLGLCHEYICLGKTIFVSGSLAAASRSKLRFQKHTGHVHRPVDFCFWWEGSLKTTAIQRDNSHGCARPGAMRLPFRSSSHCHGHTGDGRAAEKTGESGKRGWLRSCHQEGAKKLTWSRPHAKPEGLPTALTTSPNGRGLTAHPPPPSPGQTLWTLGNSRLPRTDMHSPRPALLPLAGRETDLEPSSAASARQPRTDGQTLVFRFKLQETQKQSSNGVPGRKPQMRKSL